MIYLLEDDDSIRKLVLYTLSSQGMAAEGFSRPSEFKEALRRSLPELVLLDVMLPEENGLDILRKLRQAETTRTLPVILLTARDSEFDKVVGLDSGADDYLPKPFGMMELLARIRAVLRRSAPAVTEYRLGELTVQPDSHQVFVQGQPVALTLKEFELLRLLLCARGNVLTRDQLLNRIWGYAFDGTSRTVDVHIRGLRQKLGPAGSRIETVRGVGYRIGRDDNEK